MKTEPSALPNTAFCDQPLALRELSDRHRTFWLEQSILRDRRISDSAIYSSATRDMRSEEQRGIPLKNRKTLELALADADEAKKAFHREHSRKGGEAPKEDALNSLIRGLVLANRDITSGQLTRELRRLDGKGDIEFISGYGEIRFWDPGGREKTAPVLGLKDRLSRIKAKINSR